MSTRQLPPNPSLRHLKNEAKSLHRSICDGDRNAVSAARTHLRRLSDIGDAEVADAGVTLQESQHIIAREYGFSDWTELLEAVEPSGGVDGLGLIASLPPRELGTLLRTADRRDVVNLLIGKDDAERARLLDSLSPRMRRWAESDLASSAEIAADDAQASRARIESTLRELTENGRSGRPAEERGTTPSDPYNFPHELIELIRQPVTELSEDELGRILRALTEFVSANGLNACEEIADAAHQFIGEGLRLIIDGREPDLVCDLLETHTSAMLRKRRSQYSIIIEAMTSVWSGDNPRIVAYKIDTLYRDKLDITDTLQNRSRVLRGSHPRPAARDTATRSLPRPQY